MSSHTPSLSASDRSRIAALLDATMLTPEQSDAELHAFVAAAAAVQSQAVCVLPKQVEKIQDAAEAAGLKIACVIGFPHGANLVGAKTWEATLLNPHVDEYDYVPDLDAVLTGNWAALENELKRFKFASGYAKRSKVLKLILETALLNDALIRDAVNVAVDCGFDFVKTSTGLHPAGGASLKAVETMVQAANGRIQVKASGGINTLESAFEYLNAGATRLGSAKLVHVLAGEESKIGGSY